MALIICKECGLSVEKREGSLFCSNRCKNRFWNRLSVSQTPNEVNPILKGVIGAEIPENISVSTIPEFIDQMNSIPNPEHGMKKRQVEDVGKRLKVIKTEIARCQSEISHLEREGGLRWLGGITAGACSFGAAGAFVGFLYGLYADHQWIRSVKQRAEGILALRAEIAKLNEVLLHENKAKAELLVQLATIPEYLDQLVRIPNPEYKELLPQRPNMEMGEEVPVSRIVYQQSPLNVSQPSVKRQKRQEKIISSQELEEMNFLSFDFQGDWKNFLGQPGIDFFMVIHGRPGSGKSTFCVRLANYLAESFGPVLFVSGEEGFSKTLRDKVVRTRAFAENLFFADLHTIEEINATIDPKKFHFIILDSLNNLGLDDNDLRKLRERFSGLAMIAIAQSTKDGKMRGSNVIAHDCDIEVAVEKGIARTIKNRYHPTDKEYLVFDQEGPEEEVFETRKDWELKGLM
jgi:hypothetical protein